jgi:methionyl-tRNA formyltransferase
MRTALLFQDGNFIGREYFARLVEVGRSPELVATVGRMKPESVAREIERTDGLWNPAALAAGVVQRHFESTADPALAALLRDEGIAVAIQGGVAILRDALLEAPTLGWLNVHPGALPAYRGNSCPEWAVLNGDDVVATAHLIDQGIDTGPIVFAMRYRIHPTWGYHDFRAHLYRHCAETMIRALELLEVHGRAAAKAQTTEGACYRPAMTSEQLASVKSCFPLGPSARRRAS